jgi:hypothetical protein
VRRKRDTARCVTTSIEGETTPGMGKGGDDASWTDVNFTGPKNKENQRD